MASLHQQFTEQEKRDLHFIFSLYDVEEDGRLQEQDVLRALRQLGFVVERTALDQHLTGGRSNARLSPRTGGFSLDNFLSIVARLQVSSYDVHEELMQAFQKLDSGRDGFLSVEELKYACTELKFKLSQREIQNMVEEADKDGDGRVSKEEFIQIMLKTPLFLSTKT